MKTIVFSTGRFNPPHVGHQKLINKMIAIAQKEDCEFRIYPTHTQDSHDNPLHYIEKVKFLRRMFPNVKNQIKRDDEIKTPFDVMEQLASEGFEKVIMVVGEDRVQEFKDAFKPYIGKDNYKNIKHFSVVSAGHRNKISKGIEGVTSTKVRKAAKENDFEKFVSYLPKQVSDKYRSEKLYKELFDAVREGLKVSVKTKEEPVEESFKSFKQFIVEAQDKELEKEEPAKEEPKPKFVWIKSGKLWVAEAEIAGDVYHFRFQEDTKAKDSFNTWNMFYYISTFKSHDTAKKYGTMTGDVQKKIFKIMFEALKNFIEDVKPKKITLSGLVTPFSRFQAKFYSSHLKKMGLILSSIGGLSVKFIDDEEDPKVELSKFSRKEDKETPPKEEKPVEKKE